MSDKQRKAAIRAKTAKRKKIERKLAAVAANRDRWIKRNEKKTSRDSFDRKVMRSLAAQATDIGVSFD